MIVGDRILVRSVGGVRTTRNNTAPSDRWFEGHVHKVEQLLVGLVFDPSFHALPNARFDVRFKLSRLPLRRMHQALETSFLEPRVLFPSAAIVRSLGMAEPRERDMREMRPYERMIGENHPQWLAVVAITKLRPGTVPFVVFGP